VERDRLFVAHSAELTRADQLQIALDNKQQELTNAQEQLLQKEQELSEIADKLTEYLASTPQTEATDAQTLQKESEIFLLKETINQQQTKIADLQKHIDDLEQLRGLYQLVEQMRGEPEGVDLNQKNQPSEAGFGSDFPNNPRKSDMFVRVDMLPHKVFKFNGNKWIEVDKNSTDTYIFNDEYVRHLVDMLARGEIELDHINETEQAQIKALLRRESRG
jgi:hypothetical protein